TIRLQDKAGATRTPRGPSGGALSDFAPPAASRAAGTVGAARPAQAPRPPAKAAAPTAKASAPERAAAWLLRPAPQPTLNGWRYALAALPVAAFATLVWLAYRLSN
ncbi:MAG TPA: hypothetical protein VEZ38_03565, partial [Paenibacillus sp.]|nr:hypothetical protein [Paenibacillus sp.]